MSGLFIQWGKRESHANEFMTVSFTITYIDSPFVSVLKYGDSSSSFELQGDLAVTYISNTGFKADTSYSSTIKAYACWIAIGY